MSLYYAGIGSRQTPPKVLKVMEDISSYLQKLGYVLRSGGADGADSAFERAIDKSKPNSMEIFLPWNGFNGRGRINAGYISDYSTDAMHTAQFIAAEKHPNWINLKESVRKLMIRNVFQVLGPTLESEQRSKFVICWTPDGCESDKTRSIITGGTGMAISVASKFSVPVINLNSEEYKHLDADAMLDKVVAYARNQIPNIAALEAE
jgi:hypothetical protein